MFISQKKLEKLIRKGYWEEREAEREFLEGTNTPEKRLDMLEKYLDIHYVHGYTEDCYVKNKKK